MAASTCHPILRLRPATTKLASCRARSINRTSFLRMPRSMEVTEAQKPAVAVLHGDQGITEAARRGTTRAARRTRTTTATTALSTSATR